MPPKYVKKPNQNSDKLTKTTEDEPPTDLPEKPKKGNKSVAKQNRDGDRITSFRGKQSEKTCQQDKEALYEKLFFGYKNITEAMKNIELQQTQRTVILPISTRSAGFIIRNMVSRFVRLGVLALDEAKTLAGALYRITLMQIDYKLEEAMLLQHSRNLELQSFDDTYLTSDIRRSLDLMGAGFSPLINYINSLGFVKTTAKSYLPRHPKVNTIVVPPYYQRFSTLRTTVEQLSGETINADAKRSFMERSPFPNAVWDVHRQRVRGAGGELIPETVNLSNPNDIIPPNYGLAQVRDDISVIATAIEKVGRKYPKYICTGGIDWKGQGSVSQIVSNAPAPLRCPSWPLHGQVTLTEGEYDEFWTADSISDPEVYMGVVYLYGEVDLSVLTVSDCAAYRSRKAACREINLDYASVMQNLLN